MTSPRGRVTHNTVTFHLLSPQIVSRFIHIQLRIFERSTFLALLSSLKVSQSKFYEFFIHSQPRKCLDKHRINNTRKRRIDHRDFETTPYDTQLGTVILISVANAEPERISARENSLPSTRTLMYIKVYIKPCTYTSIHTTAYR